MKKAFFLVTFTVLAAVLLSGCGSDDEKLKVMEEQDVFLNTETAGTAINEDDLERIRHGEGVKDYVANRYVSATDSSLMHEKGLIYRVERKSKWNLRPNQQPGTRTENLYANTINQGDPAVVQPLLAEFERDIKEISETKEILRQNAQNVNNAAKEVARTAQKVGEQQSLATQNKEDLQLVRKNLEDMKEQYSKLKNQLEALDARDKEREQRSKNLEELESVRPKMRKETDDFNLDLTKPSASEKK